MGSQGCCLISNFLMACKYFSLQPGLKHNDLCTHFSVQLGFQRKESALLNHSLKTKRALILKTRSKFSCKAYLKFLNLEQNLFKIFQKVFQNFSKFCSRFFKSLLPNSLQSLKMSKHMLVLRGSISVYNVFVTLKQNLFKNFSN